MSYRSHYERGPDFGCCHRRPHCRCLSLLVAVGHLRMYDAFTLLYLYFWVIRTAGFVQNITADPALVIDNVAQPDRPTYMYDPVGPF